MDALKVGTIVGTTMAKLNGAIYSYQMPHTKIGFSIPVEKLFHVNGTPRESYIPRTLVTGYSRTGDLILERAILLLKKNR
jgi:carboxyl-terminal processing protease